jgi:predicted ester cyclase
MRAPVPYSRDTPMKKRPQQKSSKAKTVKRAAVKTRKPAKKKRSASVSNSKSLRSIAQRWFEELWNQRNPGVLKELLDPAAVGNTEGGRISGHTEFIDKLHSPLIGAFPDLRVTLEDIVAEGDSAAVRWTFEATHAGDTLGIPATNRRVKVSGMSWLKCKNGRLVAGWDRWNSHGLMSYLKDGTKCATVRDSTDW